MPPLLFQTLQPIAFTVVIDGPKLKERMSDEGAVQVLTKCQKLPLPGKDGKSYPGDCADIETINFPTSDYRRLK